MLTSMDSLNLTLESSFRIADRFVNRVKTVLVNFLAESSDSLAELGHVRRPFCFDTRSTFTLHCPRWFDGCIHIFAVRSGILACRNFFKLRARYLANLVNVRLAGLPWRYLLLSSAE